MCLTTRPKYVILDEAYLMAQETCPMTESQVLLALSEDAALPDTPDLTSRMPGLCVADYCARLGRLLNARRFAKKLLDD